MNSISLSSALSKLGNLRCVENAPSIRGNGTVRNQFILTYANGEVFQSYKSICGARIYGVGLALSDYHDYSVTTSKYVGDWCRKGAKERRDGLKDGSILHLEF